MSLSETQEIMSVLQEIMALLNNVEFKTTKINNDLPKTKDSLATFQQLERVALRYIALARRMGVSEDIDNAIAKFAELIVVINMVYMSFNMLQRGTPIAVLSFIATISMSILSAGNMLEGY